MRATASSSVAKRRCARAPSGEPVVDPFARALDGPLPVPVGLHLRRRAEPVHQHQLAHPLGKARRVADRHAAAERMAHDAQLPLPERLDQHRDIQRVKDREIGAVARPVAVAMAAQIGCDHVPMMPQCARRPVPAARVIAAAVEQQEQRRAVVAPVEVMQIQPLGSENSGNRLELVGGGHGAHAVSLGMPRVPSRRFEPDAAASRLQVQRKIGAIVNDPACEPAGGRVLSRLRHPEEFPCLLTTCTGRSIRRTCWSTR